jgi:hypothetical protein
MRVLLTYSSNLSHRMMYSLAEYQSIGVNIDI